MRGIIAVVVGAAILVAGASGGAAAVRLIGSAQIQDNSVRSVDIRDGDLAAADLQPGIQSTIHSALTGYTVRESRQTLSGDTEGEPFKVWQVHCPAGKVVLGGGEQIGEAFDLLASFPAYDETTRRANGWIWRLHPNIAPDSEADVWFYVTCADG